MFLRIKSEIWVSALLRRARGAGAFATVLHSGAEEAGAIFVVVNRGGLRGSYDLYAPAPQSLTVDDDTNAYDRRFEQRLEGVDEGAINNALASERRFDPDLWAIEIEDRDGHAFIDVISEF
ncbi:DUF1491 family protein [Ahrensia sp. R2A130]|uniref:DUF1491 family protein n=1 Tax=Ahrensia sp. R2A130 TaxID=744979 RepID=UPI0001E0E0D9|nr:DUF1491 family protein [Ahrensia sp. R2A130]EFL88945.1 conserved hypothetical protein [Ahrensia sp. R2A130]